MPETRVAEEPEHFQETAGLLESGVRDKELLQKVFFKEINQWIAAPTGTEVNLSESETRAALDEELERTSLVERDAHTASEFSRGQARERERLEQHDLSLSIGSISIVIEEPPQTQPQQFAPAPPAPTRASRDASGSTGFSRLSRHYIR
jgi:hypothetical protein